MATRFGLFAMIVLVAWPLRETGQSHRWIIWNVGQGQWVTYISELICLHFDAGGERAPWLAVQSRCADRENRFVFSHWDWDHISFAATALQRLPNVCILIWPSGQPSPKKQRWLKRLRNCRSPAPSTWSIWSPRHAKSANGNSRVFMWRGLLIPGDSPASEEHQWVHALSTLNNARVLILGHHGSRTSTSEELLRALPALRLAVASSRRARYGHPHFQVQQRLRRWGIPLLTTEDWGHIEIEE